MNYGMDCIQFGRWPCGLLRASLLAVAQKQLATKLHDETVASALLNEPGVEMECDKLVAQPECARTAGAAGQSTRNRNQLWSLLSCTPATN